MRVKDFSTQFLVKFVLSLLVILAGLVLVLMNHGLPQFIGILLMFFPIGVAIGNDISHASAS